MKVLIGNKKEFAIEFKQSEEDERLGYAKIWFGGNSLGTNEDLIYKSYLIQGLEDIGQSKTYIPSNLNPQDLYLQLKSSLQDEKVFRFLIGSFGTFCDDYTIFSFIDGNTINILWRLENTNTPFNDLNNLSQEVHHFTIDKNLYSEQVSAIAKELNFSSKII